MDTNDMINDALQKGNKISGGNGLSVLEGHTERNELRVLPPG